MSADKSPIGRIKRLVKASLRAVGPSPELVSDLVHLQMKLEADERDLAVVAEGLSALESTLRINVGGSSSHDAQQLGDILSELRGTVVGLGETLHAHQAQLNQLQMRLDRVAGSVMDATALDRRLAKLENQIFGLADAEGAERPNGSSGDTATDKPTAALGD